MNKSKSLHSFFVFFCTVLLFSTKMQGQCNPISDSLELVKLYDATNGNNWTNKTNWKVIGMPISTWYGVRVNTQGCVTCIDLDGNDNCNFIVVTGGNNLVGTLPNLNLDNLKNLFLSGNKLTGTIPNFNLPNLQNLGINNNQLTGSIPNFNLPNLQQLLLSSNQLTGSVPNFNLPNLQELVLSYNQLTGSIPNFNLPNLQQLLLNNTQLTGSVPNFNLPNLQQLWLGSNQLTDSIPNFNLPNLQQLYLNNNQFIGSIPNFNLPNLQQLWLGGNQLTDFIPNFNLPNLQTLFLNNNQLIGSIPNFNLPNLQTLFLNNNQLIGSIPNFNLPNLQYLFLNNNQLIGSIPNFNLPNLQTLDIKNNQLTGVPNLTYIRTWGGSGNILSLENNFLTFKDIISNIPIFNAWVGRSSYAPQYSIYKDTTFTIRATNDLTIDLNIDGAITNSNYKWFKNGIFLKDTNRNKLILRGVTPTDAGVYTCQVTNPDAPDLTLVSRNITVKVLTCREQDSLVLMDLYRATNGANWTNKWDTTKPIDTWFGVTLDAQGCVICIDLDGLDDCNDSGQGNNLVGILPNLKIDNLKSLFLTNNQLTGSIPNFNMPNLQNLFLSHNQLSGTVPNFNLPNLQSLILFDNQLTGSIPNFNLPNLQFLDIFTNKLTGSIPNFNMPNLKELRLFNNQLSGSIPNFDMPNLQNLDIHFNQLTGSIPNFNMPNLKVLQLHHNQLTGSIPNFNMPNLRNLILAYNQLSGSIPNFNTPNLQFFDIESNQLSGSIPNFNMLNLQNLFLSGNQLKGTIPDFNMPNLEALFFYQNKIDSCPNFTNLLSLKKDSIFQKGLRNFANNLTFDDILPNIGFATTATYIYTPQNAIYKDKDTTITVSTANDLIIDLKIDGAITNNNYKWFKNGIFLKDTNRNQLILRGVKLTDAGVYTCEVTNPDAPLLTLNTRNITVKVLTCREQDSLVLMDLYRATNGANWTNKWDTTQPIDTWYGVRLNADGCVTCIDLDGISGCNVIGSIGNNLVGTLPVTLNNLQSLTDLYLSYNKLTGNIPNFNMSNLHNLGLKNNRLDGNIPNFNLPNLNTLNLNNNNLGGVIPNLNLPNLRSFIVQFNQLVGTIPDFNMPNIRYLGLTDNQLSGVIPNFNMPNLEQLLIDYNKLTGSIPTFNLPKLNTLNLRDNELSGSIPNFNLPNLQSLILGSNQLSGTIPSFNLPNLKELVLNNNQLNGVIPNFNMPNLQSFDLSTNKLNGTIPNFNMPNLQYLYLHSNQLSGIIPNFNLPNLTDFWIYKNKYTFENILSPIQQGTKNSVNFNQYFPQDTIFKDTTINIQATNDLTIDLNIDGAITNSNYKWFKNGIFLKDTNRNKLILRGVTPTDAGVYTCQVTNPDAPLLTLNTRNITVKVLTCREQDSLVLMDLYRATNGANWTNKWDTTKSIDTWFGVSLTTQGCVERVFLPNNGLIDTIPNLDLPNLIQLTLSRNQLKGSIPNFNLPKLVGLALSDNKLNGNIPNFNLPELQTLSLFSNELSDTIPNFNLPKLQSLLLNDNKLSGRIPNFNLPNLQVLWLYLNQLSGTIPNFNLLTKLEQLALSNNQLSGTIPDFSFAVLKSLHLNNNKLTGCFPSTLKVHCALGFNTTIGQNGYNFTNNPALPWSGDFALFCNNNNQIGASCNDGNAATQKDIITASCTCAGRICTSIEAIDDKVIIKDNETITEFTTTSNDRFDAGAQITATVLKKPQYGQLDSLGLGKFRYEMLPTLRGSIQNFTYRICDTACLNLCDTAQVSIEIQGLSPVIKSSKGITPYNQDGKNDVLEFDEIEDPTRYPNNELIIYNRWNSIIYRAQPYLNNWGGINLQGQQLPTGTYYYILHLDKKANETLTGDVVIIR